MAIKKLNFKQKKYILPLIALPFVLFFAYQGSKFMAKPVQDAPPQQELSLSLGDTQDSILSKYEAYNAFFEKKR